MARTAKSEYTYNCDRCGKISIFNDADFNNEEKVKEAASWKQLNTGFILILGGESFDLCPNCFKEFQEAFMTFIPPAFRKALE